MDRYKIKVDFDVRVDDMFNQIHNNIKEKEKIKVIKEIIREGICQEGLNEEGIYLIEIITK